MFVISRNLIPGQRSEGLNDYIPFIFVSAGLAGVGYGASPLGAAVPMVLALGWAGALWPDFNQKLPADCLGFFLWFASSVVVSREFRLMAVGADQADTAAEIARTEAAEQRHLADLAHEKDRAHHEIHDRLLPIVDAMGRREDVDGGLGRTYPALRRRGGDVNIDSSPGRGTKVTIVWPSPARVPAVRASERGAISQPA